MVDVELPVLIEVSREIDGSELNDGLCHLLGPAHSGTFQAVFDQMLARAFDRATGDRPALGKVFVIAHPGAVSVKEIGDSLQRQAVGSGETAFGNTLTNTLDYLADVAGQNSQSPVQDPEIALQ